MQNPTTPAHRRLAAQLVTVTRAHGGLAPVDLKRFHADQEIAGNDAFGKSIPQCPLGIWMSGECVYAELGIPEDPWRYDHDEAWRLQLNKAYNDLAERLIGKRLLPETRGEPRPAFPPAKALQDIFEAKNVWHAGSWWLEQVAHNEGELEALLDRVEARLANLRAFLLPPEWDQVKDGLLRQGVKPPAYRGQRGPVTFATSVYGPENLVYLIQDNPDLAARFRDAIRNAMLGVAKLLDAEAGYKAGEEPHGFGFADDNCCLLTARMYEFFALPIVKAVFDYCSPNPGDSRYQHSDSDMGHIVPVLAKMHMTGVNFGPTVPVSHIRRHLPKAVIYGQLAPFTFSRNEEEGIVAEFIRDFELAREHRGLVFSTAGSINNGSRLAGLRLIMAAIQRYGRYDA